MAARPDPTHPTTTTTTQPAASGTKGAAAGQKTRDAVKTGELKAEQAKNNVNDFADNLMKPKDLGGGAKSDPHHGEFSGDSKKAGAAIAAGADKLSKKAVGHEKTERMKDKAALKAQKAKRRGERRGSGASSSSASSSPSPERKPL